MKRYSTIAVILLVLLAAAVNAETNINTKLLFHATKPVTDTTSNWQICGWMVIPNPGAMVINSMVGLRYEVKDEWWVETQVGVPSKEQTGRELIDIRASYDILDPIHFWTNLEYFPDKGDWYGYIDANYKLPVIGLVGMELENSINNRGKDDWGLGPRIVLPFSDGKYVFVWAYQFCPDDDYNNQLWVRSIINF